MLLGILIFAGIVPGASAAEAYVNWNSLHVYAAPELANTRINPQSMNGETCLVLPSNISPEAVCFGLEAAEATEITVTGAKASAQLIHGEALNLLELCGESEMYSITFTAANGTESSEFSLKVMFSENIGAMFLISDDPVNQGRQWVEASADKSNKATGSMTLLNSDSSVVYDGALTQIKGRGNSTWKLPKRPYQIKLDSKTDLLQTGDSDNKSKTWILLANYSDISFLRNSMALNLGIAMDMDYNVQNTYVDLYYDGEYRGNYMLTEKVEVGSGRVDITDLEELNEEANPDQDLEDFEIAVGSTANGASYRYCVGMASPADITGGYLLEMEASYRAVNEACYFWTSRGDYVVVKSPEFCSKEQMDYIATLYQEYEDAVYSNGVNPTTGKRYTDYVDLTSTARCYLINEMAKNLDGFRTSAFLHKEAGEDMMYMGPLWDYDLGFGVGAGVPLHVELQRDPTGLYTARGILMGVLYEMGDFRAAVKDQWENNLSPLMTSVVLGDASAVSQDGALHALAYYRELLPASAACDFALWRGITSGISQNWLGHVDYLTNYLTQRTQSMNQIIATWNADTYEKIPYQFDVDFDAWYHDEVGLAVRYGLMRGTGYNMFLPEDIATRAMVAQTIYNMEDPGVSGYQDIFTDVSAGQYYTDAVCWGAGKSIINGYPDGSFKPDNNITREDLVTLLYRYSGEEVTDTAILAQFTDGESVSDYAEAAMSWAISEGVINGYLGNTLRPQNSTTRAELAAILARYYSSHILNAE